jgi:tetratricopeptide (TPR) repeat protein
MVNNRRTFSALGLLWSVSLIATPTWAQSKNPQAISLFKQAAGETDIWKKIANYQQAIALDSLFVEALFNLGLVYKQQQEYASAELYLSKAYNANPSRIKDELKIRILHELANANKRLGKYREAEEALRGAKALASDNALQSKIWFELGRLLYDEGRYAEAIAELLEGQQLHSADKTYFTNLIQLSEKALELQALYASATNAEANGNVSEAQALFEQIQAKMPGYKDVASRMAALDSISKARLSVDASLAAKYDQAKQYQSEGNLEMAVALFEEVVREAGDYRHAESRLATLRQQLAEQQRLADLESEYANAAAALRTQNWTRAVIALERIMAVDENYRDAKALLSEAQAKLEKESVESICVRYYADGVAAMNQKDLGAALAAFEKIQRLSPNYRDTANLLAVVENQLQEQSRTAAANLSLLPASSSALDAAVQGDMTLQENAAAGAVGSRGRPSYSLVATATVAVIVLPVLGFIFFSPIGRARLCLMLGNYTAAMRIYEEILMRHPERARLNHTILNTLATYYVLERRTDPRAMEIYQQVQKLNMPVPNREEINSILSQHYLGEGRKSVDAAEVLERLLNSKNPRTESSE